MGPDGTRVALGRLPEMIDQDVLTRVLGTAAKSGADFAEVFAEDKRSTSAGLDDGRIAERLRRWLDANPPAAAAE